MKKLFGIFVVGVMCVALCGCGSDVVDDTTDQIEDAVDQVANAIQAEDENVLAVKGGTNSNYPNVTYGDAFEAYFGSPTWKYFKGIQEGPDDDGDGTPDFTKEDIDVVEFTGYCMYADVEVKAMIQFTLNKEAGTFDATYLAFNEVPQSTLMLSELISSVFESYLEENSLPADNGTEKTEISDNAENEKTLETDSQAVDRDDQEDDEYGSPYPAQMNYYPERLEPLDVAGYYGGDYGQSVAYVNIYSSPEDIEVGNATIYFDSEIERYGGNEYSGELLELDTNLYCLVNDGDEDILIGVNYDADNDLILLEVWIDGQYVETYYMSEHYES